MTIPRDKWRKAHAARAVALEWERDTRGRILSGNLKNIRQALAHIGIILSYDAFARELRVNGKVIEDDITIERIWTTITDKCGWQPNRRNLLTVILCDAQAQATHPVRDYLARLVWDGTPRLDRWLVTYAGVADTEYVRAVGALPLLAAVRRIRLPGAKFDELLILEGGQGTDKSSAIKALCAVDDWFSDDLPLGADSQKVIEHTAGKWIIEAAELVSNNRGKETESLKAFLSRQVDGPARMAYGRLSITRPRQFIIIGTTNHRGNYLKDGTGARRFWPVTVSACDLAAITRDRDQLWAEAVSREPDTSIRLASSLWKAAGVEQEARRAADPWEELIEPLLNDGITRTTRISASAIWDALGVAANMRDNRQAARVAAVLDRNGYEKKQDSDGRNVWKLKEEPVQNE